MTKKKRIRKNRMNEMEKIFLEKKPFTMKDVQDNYIEELFKKIPVCYKSDPEFRFILYSYDANTWKAAYEYHENAIRGSECTGKTIIEVIEKFIENSKNL